MSLFDPLVIGLATVIVMWVVPAAIYRWVYRSSLRWYAAPLALGALALGTRLASLEGRAGVHRNQDCSDNNDGKAAFRWGGSSNVMVTVRKERSRTDSHWLSHRGAQPSPPSW
jgi:hypothetical protein